MAQLYKYGAQKTIFFKVVNSSNQGVIGLTFDANDIAVSKDGAAGTNIGTQVTETTFGRGWYQWTPASAAQMQCEQLIIDIKDTAGGPAFAENGGLFATGGNLNAFYNGT